MGPLQTSLAGSSGIRNILYQALAWATCCAVTGAELYRMSIRNVALRERTPMPYPTVLSPPTPASAPSSPLATAPDCVVPVNTAVEQSTLGSPSCKVSLSSCSQKYWCFGARPSAANLMPSSGWDGCRDLCVLPEALKKERWHIKTQEGWVPPAEGWIFKLGEAARSLAFSLKQSQMSVPEKESSMAQEGPG